VGRGLGRDRGGPVARYPGASVDLVPSQRFPVKITVVALGKIGLPLAVQFASKGHEVIGTDVNQATVDAVNAGVEPFPGEALLGERMKAAVDAGLLRATTDTTAAVAQSDAVVVVVPLFVDAEGVPDFGWMDAATRDIAAGITPGTLVSYETTLPVGTTRERFGPMIAEISGLRAGVDFALVFSPERVLTGRVFADLRKYPKLVGGIDAESGKRGVAFYEAVLDFDDRPDLARANGVWDLGTSEASELAKLAETTYRDVNIGLANQFARFSASHGIDVFEVIEASNSQPYSHIHRPGIAVGGHCIPIYPRMYLWNDPEATVVRAAREANAAMPEYAVAVLEGAYGDLTGARVAVLGAAYRGGVKETAFSGVFPTVEALRARGAEVLVHDPMYTDDELAGYGWSPYHLGEPIDAVVIQADHASYRTLAAGDLPGVQVLVDGRRVTDPGQFPGVTRRVLGTA
jgi:nucleotide sugar dehydrogenase